MVISERYCTYSAFEIFTDLFLQENVLVSDDGVAQINDFDMSRILETQGFTTKILRNIRFNAPELMPITEETCDILPTFQSDIFSLGILFLQVFLTASITPACR